jgi:hypothetical protein
MSTEKSKILFPKIIFWINAIVSLIFGIGFVFIPGIIFESIGFSTNNDGLTMVRYCGIFFIALAVLYFLVRKIKPSPAKEAVHLFFAFSHIFGGLLLILYAAIGNTSILAVVPFWLTVALHFTFPPFHIYFIVRDWKEVRALGKMED